ncbi:MAG: VOC family protein [Salinirussus sp.]
MSDPTVLPEATRVARVDLRVPALDPAGEFYGGGLGFAVDRDGDIMRCSADGDSSVLILEADPDATPRAAAAAGLYHVAYRHPDRTALAATLARLRAAGYRLTGVADHVASEALYLDDPAGNGVELYTDRPREEWEYTDAGEVRLPGEPLDIAPIEAAAPADPGARIHPDTDIGHVHLEVTDLERSAAFYRDVLGFNHRLRKPRALFLAGGEYHHHIALNTRQGRTQPYDPDAQGLVEITFDIPPAAFDRLQNRVADAGIDAERTDERLQVRDPDGIPLAFRSA